MARSRRLADLGLPFPGLHRGTFLSCASATSQNERANLQKKKCANPCAVCVSVHRRASGDKSVCSYV